VKETADTLASGPVASGVGVQISSRAPNFNVP
jgi:hypothetical protein